MPQSEWREINLRVYISESKLLRDKEGEIEIEGSVLPSPPSLTEDRYMLDLPDGTYYLSEFPVTLRARQGKKEMHLRLDASVDSIRFREGEYDVPWEYEPLFHLRPLNGSRITNQDIAYFEVPGIAIPPNLGKISMRDHRPRIFAPDDSTISTHTLTGSASLYECWGEGPMYGKVLYNAAQIREEFQWDRGAIVSHDSGESYRTFIPWGLHYTNPYLLSAFFKPNGNGWVMMLGYELRLRVAGIEEIQTYASTDGGKSWQIDSSFAHYHIIAGQFVSDTEGWLIGVPEDPKESVITLILYKTDDGGRTLSPVASLEKYVGINVIDAWGRMSGIIPFNRDHVILAERNGNYNDIIAVDGKWKSTEVRSRLEDFERVDDSTAYMARSSWRDRSYACADTLFKTSNGGKSWQPILAGDRFYSVSFFNAERGCIISSCYVLLTEDGGKNWRYIPFDSLEEKRNAYSQGSIPLEYSEGLWFDKNHLRLIKREGLLYVDFSFKDLPPLPIVKLDENEGQRSGDIR